MPLNTWTPSELIPRTLPDAVSATGTSAPCAAAIGDAASAPSEARITVRRFGMANPFAKGWRNTLVDRASRQATSCSLIAIVDRMRGNLLGSQASGETTLPHIKTSDGIHLYYEETGEGHPLLFLHEFGGHYLSWEPQVRYFSRRYRSIAFAARSWPPSDVPDDVSSYSQARAADDCADVMAALGIERAHLVGLSMGATAALEFAIRHPGKATALVIAAGGGGGATDPEAKARFRQECETFARRIEQEGMPAMAELYCASSARVTYRYKDPRGWAEFKRQFAEGSAKGHAMTMRGVQGARQ